MKNDRRNHNITETVQYSPDPDARREGGVSIKRFADLIDIFLLFLVSRITLTVIGALSLTLVGRRIGGRLEWAHPPYRWLDVWGQWDTGWYLDIAKNWYAGEAHYGNFSNYVFFPLYPTLIKMLGAVIGNYFYAGLIISNVSVLGAAVLLYRLVLLDHDKEVALNAVKYMLIWPTSFVLSGVLSEGLFLMLLVACFYQARRNAWLRVGMTGFFLSLTRVIGVCAGAPLLYDYLKARDFSLRAIRADMLALAFLPAGLLLFCAYNYYLTGDFLAFVHLQSAWGRHPDNPFKTLLYGMAGIGTDFFNIVSAWFTGIVLAGLIVFYRKMQFSHLLFCLFAIFIPLSSGLMSLPRFTAVLFPVFILLAQLGKDRKVDLLLTIVLSVLQGCLMVFWSIGSAVII